MASELSGMSVRELCRSITPHETDRWVNGKDAVDGYVEGYWSNPNMDSVVTELERRLSSRPEVPGDVLESANRILKEARIKGTTGGT